MTSRENKRSSFVRSAPGSAATLGFAAGVAAWGAVGLVACTPDLDRFRVTERDASDDAMSGDAGHADVGDLDAAGLDAADDAGDVDATNPRLGALCDLDEQDCGEGLHCYSDSAADRCFPPGTTPTGGPCETAPDCLPNHTCVYVTFDIRTCMQLCERDTDCPRATRCSQALQREPARYVCNHACDPLTNEGCVEGLACTIVLPAADMFDDAFTTCRIAGTGARFDACSTEETCGPGLTCPRGQCDQWCIAGVTGACPPGESCQPPTIFRDLYLAIDGRRYGTCRLE